MQTSKAIALRVVELVLFIVALGFIIPPIPSDLGQVYRSLPALLIGGTLFAGSMALALWRGAEHWLTAVLKLLAYLCLVRLIYERVFQY
jgi:hypothetical protein